MGTDCYLAKKKENFADIEFIKLDRLYFFQDEFPKAVLYPVGTFRQRLDRLKLTPVDPDTYIYNAEKKSSQLYWIEQAEKNLTDCNYAGIIAEGQYQLYHDNLRYNIPVVDDKPVT